MELSCSHASCARVMSFQLQRCCTSLLIRFFVACVQGDYDIPLSVYYDYVFTAAEQSGAALMQPWELVPFHVPPGQPSPLLTSAHALSDPHPCGHVACDVHPRSCLRPHSD